MQWIEVITGILLLTLSGMIFSALIFVVLYLVYKIEVKNSSFNLHLRILKRLEHRIHKKSHENRLNTRMDRYHALVEKPGFIAIIIPLLIVLVIGFVLYNQMIFFAAVGSGSMEPAFKKSDLILMQNIDMYVENGDIIMFETPSVLIPVTHRVIGVSDTGIITKGDARRSRDDWVVKNEQIMGKAITINEMPIIIKDVGIYFIEDVESISQTSRYGEEFGFMRKIIATIKSLGLVIFFFAIFMYILSSIR